MDSTETVSSDLYREMLRKIRVIDNNGVKTYRIKTDEIEIRIGNTPVCVLNIDNIELLAKIEWFNYFSLKQKNFKHGSIKMRPALYMVYEALKNKTMKSIIIEPTSGNTGIALAAIAKALNLNFQPIISYKVTDEVKSLFRMLDIEAFEVDDDLCPRVSNTDTDQAIAIAKSMAYSPRSAHLYTWLNQYENYNNPKSHYDTATEIQCLKHKPDIVVVGVGTGGTYVGLKQYLEPQGIKVIGVQPESGHHIQGLRNLAESPLMPKILEDAKVSRLDFPIVTDTEAFAMVKKVYHQTNILLGASSGAVLYYAAMLAKQGKKVLAILADTGYNYQKLYRDLHVAQDHIEFNDYYNIQFLRNHGLIEV